MLRVAVSCHRGLPADTTFWSTGDPGGTLESAAKVTGLSCLADGADQIFARAFSTLTAISRQLFLPRIPGWPASAGAGEYDWLLARAVALHRLTFTESTPEAHMAASRLMIDEADELYAVWTGSPPVPTADR